MKKNTKAEVKLLHDTKRVYVYQYGLDGKITVSKRLKVEDDMDILDAIETQSIEVQNSSDTNETITISNAKIDVAAFSAINTILDLLS